MNNRGELNKRVKFYNRAELNNWGELNKRAELINRGELDVNKWPLAARRELNANRQPLGGKERAEREQIATRGELNMKEGD